MSLKDSLTGLYNRRIIDFEIHRLRADKARYGGKIAAVSIDMDSFGDINNTYGHDAGDEALKLVATVLKSRFRRETDIVVRMGGDEFTALWIAKDIHKTTEFIIDLKCELSELSMMVGEKFISFSASLGSAVETSGESVKCLLKMADISMYDAKPKK